MLTRLRNRSIRWSVGVHLFLVMLLVVVNLGGFAWFLHEQRHAGTAINRAGEQRMLVEKMTLEAHLVGMDHPPTARSRDVEALRADLAADAAAFDRALAALIDGNESMGLDPAPPSVREQLRVVRAAWDPFYAHVRTMLAAPRTTQRFDRSLAYVETHDADLLAASDEAVERYQRAFGRKVTRFELFLVGLFGLDVVAVPLLFLLVDRRVLHPVNRIATRARAIASGDLDQSIPTFDAANEIGALSHSLSEMKEQLVESLRDARRFEQAVDHAGNAIYVTDVEGTIRYANPAFEELTGYRKADAVGETPRILQSGEQSDDYYEELWETIRAGDLWKAEIVNERASGERFHAYETIGPITDDGGDVVGYVAIMADLTEQMVRDQQNQVLSRVLRHNLRTELNLIEGYARELETCDADARPEYVDNILDRVDNLVTLSDVTSRFMRHLREDSEQESQPVCETAERVCSRVAARYPNAHVTVDGPTYELYVLANVSVVLDELVENAVEHNDQPRPEVSVTVTRQSKTGPPPTVVVTVEDDGPGIPLNERRVIEEGEETPLFHGSGLGLWTVHWLITLAGGAVAIADRSPRGTRVTLTIPHASVSPFPRSDIDGLEWGPEG